MTPEDAIDAHLDQHHDFTQQLPAAVCAVCGETPAKMSRHEQRPLCRVCDVGHDGEEAEEMF